TLPQPRISGDSDDLGILPVLGAQRLALLLADAQGRSVPMATVHERAGYRLDFLRRVEHERAGVRLAAFVCALRWVRWQRVRGRLASVGEHGGDHVPVL